MKWEKVLPIFVVGALAVTTLFGVAAYRVAYAQSATPTTPSTAAPNNNGSGHDGFGGITSDNLAKALGITTAQLTTAYQKANGEALAQAVSKGLITQAQADQIKTNGSAFPLGNRWMDWLSQNGIDYNSLLANALGISADKLQAANVQAYNAGIDQAVTDSQLTQQQADLMKGEYALYNNKDFQASMQSAFKTAVQNAVTSGVITQSQADQILSNANSMGFPGFKGFGDGFPGIGGPHGRGGSGMWDSLAPGNTPSTAPTATPSTSSNG